MNSHKKVSINDLYPLTSDFILQFRAAAGALHGDPQEERRAVQPGRQQAAVIIVSVNIWIINEFRVKTPRTVVQC